MSAECTSAAAAGLLALALVKPQQASGCSGATTITATVAVTTASSTTVGADAAGGQEAALSSQRL